MQIGFLQHPQLKAIGSGEQLPSGRAMLNQNLFEHTAVGIVQKQHNENSHCVEDTQHPWWCGYILAHSFPSYSQKQQQQASQASVNVILVECNHIITLYKSCFHGQQQTMMLQHTSTLDNDQIMSTVAFMAVDTSQKKEPMCLNHSGYLYPSHTHIHTLPALEASIIT